MIVLIQTEAVQTAKILLLMTACLAAMALATKPVEVIAESSSPAMDFAEKQVAGSPDDFMIVRHLRLKGTNRAIGRKLAEIARDRHKVQPEPLDPVVARARRDFYQRNYPTHFARSLGAAEAFNLTLETTNLNVTALYINMNLSPSCSTVYYPPASTESGHGTLSRNYDFSTGTAAQILGVPGSAALRPMTGDVYVVEVYPDEGYPSLYITPYDLLGGAMDGINSKGLTVALLADDESEKSEPAQGAQAGLAEVELPRFLLDTCATVEDAKAALMTAKQYYSFVPCHYIIGDRSGKSFIWEYSAAHNREYITDGAGKPQIITNHLVHRYKKLEDMPNDNSPGSSYLRMRRLDEEIGKVGGKSSIEAMKKTNLCVAVPATPRSGNPRPPGRTLWHALYDCTDNSLAVDFYLGDDPNQPTGQKRSGYLAFKLDAK